LKRRRDNETGEKRREKRVKKEQEKSAGMSKTGEQTHTTNGPRKSAE
jgi:hypothetical protein